MKEDPATISVMTHSDHDNDGSVNEGGSLSFTIDDNTSRRSDDGLDDGENNVEAIKVQLSKKETQAVNRLRFLFLFIKLAVAGVVAYIVYRIAQNAQYEAFIKGYDAASEKLITAFMEVIDHATSLSSLSKAVTIYGLDQAKATSGIARWPFMTVSTFPQRASAARSLSGALFMTLMHLVSDEHRLAWEQYTQGPERNWIEEGLAFNTKMGYDNFLHQNITSFPNVSYIYSLANFSNVGNVFTSDPGPGPYLPRWQFSPAVKSQIINQNVFKIPNAFKYLNSSFSEKQAIFRIFEYTQPGSMNSTDFKASFWATVQSIKDGKESNYLGDPVAWISLPVFNSFDDDNHTVVAILSSLVNWRSYFRFLLPNNVNGIDVVLSNSCDGPYTYQINGSEAYIIGVGDHHDTRFDAYRKNASFDRTFIVDGSYDPIQISGAGCAYSVDVYPTSAYWESTQSNQPMILAASIALVILFAVMMFLLYDRLVEKRQRYVLSKAAQSTAIVSSLFPKQVREQMLEMQEQKYHKGTNSHKLKAFMSSHHVALPVMESQIAELFPSCTVLFADIAGFTAWCSTREPTHVFILLQTVFSIFDRIAKRRKVFKVETIGDCYMAVTGLPEPQENHFAIMARFAWECRTEMPHTMRQLETRLGPDCSDLLLRFGMHSGPVTAGVLKGERSRFQLFGDTVNTAARMESTGIKDKIQLSQSTADLLIGAGKGQWITPRENAIEAKGKGKMQTYWLNLVSLKGVLSSTNNSESGNHSDHFLTGLSTSHFMRHEVESKQSRLVDWMVELLAERLRPMIAHRQDVSTSNDDSSVSYQPPPGTICLDEFKEVIIIEGNADTTQVGEASFDGNSTISLETLQDLQCYVKMIAQMYRDNPFHNFEHACHVTMSVSKLLQRIIASDMELHNCTHGLCHDYTASFAMVFSAFIHDVDHRGCSNVQLIEEEVSLAMKYRNQSVAEQNSLDLAWNVLMDDQFQQLRRVIFGNQAELMRFRQLVVNSVLATDIFDKELNDLRKKRWTKAFSEVTSHDDHHSHRKATIVLEHIIQASDVSHTMQHWHIYRKWNRRLFKEMYMAYHQGRMKADPATFWYQGELGFFDNYVIPLANKLKECNVFGASSDEYLNYAIDNRAEWASKGQDIVAELVQECSHLVDCHAIEI